LGWAGLAVIATALCLLWWFEGESFLSPTERLPAEVLVVESWIGTDGIQAAAVEFEHGGYQCVVATGGPTSERWSQRRWSYADMAERELIRSGVPKDRIIAAPASETDGQRTFEMAVAAWRTLQTRDLHSNAINVFTLGAHARRSRLVFAKVFEPGIKVGVISWTPLHDKNGPWWRSSERAEDLLKETVGYLFEALLNSARSSNSPTGHPR
jgi:hypothetical protein